MCVSVCAEERAKEKKEKEREEESEKQRFIVTLDYFHPTLIA